MALAPPRLTALLGCDGFKVVTADTRVGSVEEIWLGDDGTPVGLAVRTAGGRRGLVLVDAVLTIDDEREWVVVDPDVRILELEPPRLAHPPGRPDRVEAAWATSGATLPVRAPVPAPTRGRRRPSGDPPLVRSIVLLYVGLASVVTVVTALAFLIPYLVA